MHPHFKLLSGVLMHKGRAINRVFPKLGRQRNGPENFGAVSHGRIDNLFCRSINKPVIVRPDFKAYSVFNFCFLCGHFSVLDFCSSD